MAFQVWQANLGDLKAHRKSRDRFHPLVCLHHFPIARSIFTEKTEEEDTPAHGFWRSPALHTSCRVPSFHHPPSQPTLQVFLLSSYADSVLLAEVGRDHQWSGTGHLPRQQMLAAHWAAKAMIPNRKHLQIWLTWLGSGCALPPAHRDAISCILPLGSWHFFSHKLSFNGRKILNIRGRLVEMEEHVRPLKLQKQNRDCRQSKPVLSPPANPP